MMKIQKLLMSGLLTIMCLGCLAQNTFEGVITYSATNSIIEEKATVTLYMKGEKSRLEFESEAGGQHVMYTIILDGKGAYMISESGGAEIADPKPHEGIPNAAYMGMSKGEKVNGYLCDRLLFDTGNGKITYWMTSGLQLSHGQLPSLIRNNMPQFDGYADGFPVKMEMTDADGNIIRTQELVSITSVAVDDGRFERK